MKYRITYIHFNGDIFHESKCEKGFEQDCDDKAVEFYRQFQEEEERLSGLVSGNTDYALERVEADGTLTKIL